jgi:hypothetical protein
MESGSIIFTLFFKTFDENLDIGSYDLNLITKYNKTM